MSTIASNDMYDPMLSYVLLTTMSISQLFTNVDIIVCDITFIPIAYVDLILKSLIIRAWY